MVHAVALQLLPLLDAGAQRAWGFDSPQALAAQFLISLARLLGEPDVRAGPVLRKTLSATQLAARVRALLAAGLDTLEAQD